MEGIQAFDIAVLNGLREAVCSPFLDAPMRLLSLLGDKGFLWIAIGIILLLVRSRRRWGVLVLAALALNAIWCNLLLKPLLDRARPYEVLGFDILVAPLADGSFPSGHTSASFAAAAVLYAMDRRLGIVAYIVAVWMGLSRLYLGVHFPTDVLFGALLGWVAAQVVLWAVKKTNAGKNKTV